MTHRESTPCLWLRQWPVSSCHTPLFRCNHFKHLSQMDYVAERRILKVHAYNLTSTIWSLLEIGRRQYWHPITVRGYRESTQPTSLETWGAARRTVKENSISIANLTWRAKRPRTSSNSWCPSALSRGCSILIVTTCWIVRGVSSFHAP